MSTKRYLKNRRPVFAHCVRRDDEQEVQNGQALTPAQIYDMAQKGLPITTRNLQPSYDEGYSELDFTPPLDQMRGVDLGDLYEARQDSKSKFRRLRDAGYFSAVNQKGAE